MTKKHKKTAEFSPRAMRIYKIAQRGVAARSNQHSVLRAIDRELDTVKVGDPDPELKEKIQTLTGQLEDEQKASEILATSNSQLTADVAEAKAVGAGFESELKNAQEVIQVGSKENEELKGQIVELGKKVAELEPAHKDEETKPDADPKDDPKEKGTKSEGPGSGDPPSQPAK